jgi:ribonuclease HII
MGYGTAAHREAIAARGLTAHHRRSFCLNIQTALELT